MSSSLRVEDYARFALAGLIFLWILAALGLVASAFSALPAARTLVLLGGAVGGLLWYFRGRRPGGPPLPLSLSESASDNFLLGNAGQPRVPLTVGVSHKAPPASSA